MLVAVLAISAVGLLGVTNGRLLAAAIVSAVLLGAVYVTMRRNDARFAAGVVVPAATAQTPGASTTTN